MPEGTAMTAYEQFQAVSQVLNMGTKSGNVDYVVGLREMLRIAGIDAPIVIEKVGAIEKVVNG